MSNEPHIDFEKYDEPKWTIRTLRASSYIAKALVAILAGAGLTGICTFFLFTAKHPNEMILVADFIEYAQLALAYGGVFGFSAWVFFRH